MFLIGDMIKVDLIEYLKARKSELEAEIKSLEFPENECRRKSLTQRKIGAIGEINRIIKLLKND